MMSVKHFPILRTIPLLIAVCLVSFPAYAKYGGGSGTAVDPYQIATAEQMNAIGANPGDWGAYFKLMADVDMSAFDGKDGRPAFTVIAPVTGGMGAYLWSTPFSGVFDGNSHTISHLTITGENYRALFGYLDSRAQVRNLGLVDVNVTATGGWGYIGALGGYSFALVTHCYSTGVVRGGEYAVGGLVGYNRARVIQCFSKAEVHGTASVGGLVGESWGTVEACYSTGAVTGAAWGVGGLVGNNYGPVTQCYSAGAVAGGSEIVGGLVGGNSGATASFWDVQTSGQATSRGGTGKTTAEMQRAATFLEAGWDLVGETANGTEDLWWIDEGKDYPRLWWEVPQTPRAKYGGGTGEPNDPYLIFTAKQMNAIGDDAGDWDKHFKLMADIDLAAFDGQQGRPAFNIIGTRYDNPFTGIFDGSGHTISHLTIRGSSSLGLFGRLKYPAEVKGLGLLDINVTAGSNISSVGGLVGSNGDYLGAQKGGTITNCYSTGVVSGAGPQANFFGGLVGTNYGEVSRCYSTAVVTASWQVGGLVGGNGNFMFAQGVVKYCYSTGTVRANSAVVGGLVGENFGTVTCCCCTGAVSGSQPWPWAGGLLGSNHSTVTNCYSTGAVSGTGWYVGGLTCWSMGTVTGCFWDTQTSGQATSAEGTGKTTAEMQRASTFLAAGWDFADETNNGTEDIWWIDEGWGYPHLWWDVPQVKYGGGIGTGQDPYQIWTPDQMNTIGATPDDWHKHFKLMADVDLKGFSGTAFRMIGVHPSYGRPFSGAFDGNGKRILNFTYGVSTTIPLGIGLFAAIDEKASIEDLVLENVNIMGGTNGTIGSLVGSCQGGSISNCHVKGGTVSGQWSIGGLVGSSRGQMVNCSSSASINAGDGAGGGLMGNNESGGTVAKCCSTGQVSARSNAGGLAGANHGTISDCYSTAQASATKGWAGGLVSSNDGTILDCYSTGRVSAPGSVGGLMGGGGRTTHCFWDIQTSGQATSAGGTGKTTAQMQTAKTFLDAGWDFVGETANGMDDIWRMPAGTGYPILAWQEPDGLPMPTGPIIIGVVRANGQSDVQAPIGQYDGGTSVLRTQAGGLQDGNLCFSDRTHPWAKTPAQLVGAEYVRVFNSDKKSTTVTYTVTTSRLARVMIAVDDRILDRQAVVDRATTQFAPAGTFADTGLDLFVHENATTDRPLNVFSAWLLAGTYVFGPMPSVHSFYTIAAMD
ncbi:MAG: hypothetical protein NTZ17_18050 [Phycisphaerae bacterium]|nr:hypothetical protein [Phycisphaerae bacterium]